VSERRRRIEDGIRASAELIRGLAGQAEGIEAVCRAVVRALQDGHTVFTAGNGGSAAEALHMAEELTGRFRANRPSLPGVSLVADSTALTCIGNDFGFDAIFSRQVEGLGKTGDVLVLFSTSGNAANLALALEEAGRKGMVTVCLLGRDGGPLAGRADVEVIVPGQATERIQEAHQVILHLVLDEVEHRFSSPPPPAGERTGVGG
jgi:D-sedoheptulose 7-phosphate isomerase